MEFTLIEPEDITQGALIKVIGVGGGGGNALEHMIEKSIEGVEFVSVNTDMQALQKCNCETRIQLGEKLTSGLGAGAQPAVGREAALESREEIDGMLDGSDMVFITAGMGGGTGTGAAPVIAELAKEKGILTVAVVTKPFSFEGGKRITVATQGLDELRKYVDSLIIVPNDKLLTVLGKDTEVVDAFAEANQVLYCSVQGISELITREGLINLDFADVKTVMSEMGMAMMGSGVAEGEQRAYEAAQAAVSNPLLEDTNLKNARGLLVNVTASDNFTISELNEVGECIHELTHPDANVVIGMVMDADMQDRVRVTIVATGFDGSADGIANSANDTGGVNRSNDSKGAEGGKGSDSKSGLGIVAVSQEKTVSNAPGSHESATGRSNERDSANTDNVSRTDESFGAHLDIPAFLRRQAD